MKIVAIVGWWGGESQERGAKGTKAGLSRGESSGLDSNSRSDLALRGNLKWEIKVEFY